MTWVKTYLQGMIDEIFRTIMNVVSSVFCYLLAKVIELFCWLLDLLPPLPYAQDIGSSLSVLIVVLARANIFIPVVEFGVMFGFVVSFITIFIVIKMILKLIPWAIG